MLQKFKKCSLKRTKVTLSINLEANFQRSLMSKLQNFGNHGGPLCFTRFIKSLTKLLRHFSKLDYYLYDQNYVPRSQTDLKHTELRKKKDKTVNTLFFHVNKNKLMCREQK